MAGNMVTARCKLSACLVGYLGSKHRQASVCDLPCRVFWSRRLAQWLSKEPCSFLVKQELPQAVSCRADKAGMCDLQQILLQNADEEQESDLSQLVRLENEDDELAGLSSAGCSSACVLGVDPDVSGAIALLHKDGENVSAQVIDVPSVKVSIGKTTRRRHDAQSIVAILKQLKAPPGSFVYIEESRPFPKDGKQGWYASGFGYGIWIGILFAFGFTVVPVRSQAWKSAMGLTGAQYSKDDSRALACSMFPSLASQLQRKKDHGRAEALLIAAFGTSRSG